MKVVLKHRPLLVVLLTASVITVFYVGRWSAQCKPELRSAGRPIRQASNNKAADLPSTYLAITIITSPDDSALRQLIRDTWLKLSSKGPSVFRHFFPLGIKDASTNLLTKLRNEQEEHGDLALIDELTESYENLTPKIAASIQHAVTTYSFRFLLKVDSDSFVRLGSLLKSLKDIEHPRLYWGFLDGRAKPFRKGKWKETDWVVCDRYLPYQLGGGYVLSYSLASFIATNVKLLKMYRSEDASVGAWLAGLDVKYVHDPRFDTEFASRGCNNEYLVTHKKSPAEMKSLFSNLREKGVLCTKEFQSRPSYVYDFSVPPSQCCTRRNGSSIP